MRSVFIVVTSFSVCATTWAGGTAHYAGVPYVQPALDVAYLVQTYESELHLVYDFQVNVDSGDKWTAVSTRASFETSNSIYEGYFTFWDHPSGGNFPTPANFSYFGLAAYDTFWTSSEEFPNIDVNPSAQATTFAPGSPRINNPIVRDAEWYVDPSDPEVDGGLYTLSRFNVTGDLPPGCTWESGFLLAVWIEVQGDLYFASTGGQPHPFSLQIPICSVIEPEPSSLGLLLLGVTVVLRRS